MRFLRKHVGNQIAQGVWSCVSLQPPATARIALLVCVYGVSGRNVSDTSWHPTTDPPAARRVFPFPAFDLEGEYDVRR